MSALHVAIHEQNKAMVEFLLDQRSLDLSDCAFHAVKKGDVRITEIILDRVRQTAPGLEFASCTHRYS